MKENEKNGAGVSFIIPENMGRMNDPDGSAFIDGICGDSMEMYLVIENNIITESMFFTNGCNSSRYCGSAAARLAKGRSIKDVLRLSPAEVIDTLAGIAEVEVHCAILSVSSLHKSLADYLIRVQNG